MKTTPRISAPASTPRLNVRRDAVANRDALLRAAQTVLASDPHASLDTIARAAGLSRRALYGHFPDRDSLLRAVIAVGAQRFNRIADLTGDPDPRIALAHLAVRLWQEASIVRASANIALDDAHVADTVRALSPLRRRVRQLTREGVELGAFRRDIAPPLLAVLVEDDADLPRHRLPQPVVVAQHKRYVKAVRYVMMAIAGTFLLSGVLVALEAVMPPRVWRPSLPAWHMILVQALGGLVAWGLLTLVVLREEQKQVPLRSCRTRMVATLVLGWALDAAQLVLHGTLADVAPWTLAQVGVVAVRALLLYPLLLYVALCQRVSYVPQAAPAAPAVA